MTSFPSLMSVVDNYSRLAFSASFDDRVSACLWYDRARANAVDLTRIDQTLTLEQSASIISAFSPRVSWARNMRLATDFVSGIPVKCLGNSIRAATRARTEGFSALPGLKTNAFARAIAGDSDAVVIDAHMIRAATPDFDSVNKSQYNLCADAVRVVSREQGWTPASMQALIWIVQRGSAD